MKLKTHIITERDERELKETGDRPEKDLRET